MSISLKYFIATATYNTWWGSRYTSWGILTPTKDYILKKKFTKKFFFCLWKAVLFSSVLDIYYCSIIWQNPGKLLNHQTMIEGGGGGSRYPGWGILTPTQDCILKIFTKISFIHASERLFYFQLYFQTYIITTLFDKSDGNLFYQGTVIEGGGQDTPAGVSWPPPKTAFWKFLQKSLFCLWKAVLFSIVLDVYNYSFIWQNPGKLLNHQKMIGGGGQDTPAGVSWPPPKTAFWKFEEFLFSMPVKVCFIFNCIFRVYSWLYLTNWWKFVSSGDNDRGWGSRYPSWGILTPTKTAFWKFLHARKIVLSDVSLGFDKPWKFVSSGDND